jgi:hypothetical protein
VRADDRDMVERRLGWSEGYDTYLTLKSDRRSDRMNNMEGIVGES